MKTISRLARLGTAVLATACAGSALAAEITLTTNLLNSCVLTLSTPGVLAASSDGTMLSSEQSGGAPAVMGVVAVGLLPTVSFSSPTLTGPTPAGDTPTTAMSYNSVGGIVQTTTSALSSHQLSLLLDTFTIHGRVNSPTGFSSGAYSLKTIATCQQ